MEVYEIISLFYLKYKRHFFPPPLRAVVMATSMVWRRISSFVVITFTLDNIYIVTFAVNNEFSVKQ